MFTLILLDRSGTEEDYNELNQLMEDAASYLTDMQKEEVSKKITKKAKDDEDKQKGIELRDAAMKTLKQSNRKHSVDLSAVHSFI